MSSARLHPYQRETATALTGILSRHKAALDASDTGTGKTYTAIGVAAATSRKPMVICPKSVVSAWRRVAESLGVPLLDVLTIEKLKTGKTQHLKLSKTINPKWTKGSKLRKFKKTFVWNMPRGSLIIWDEIHNASGYDSENGKVLALTKAYGLEVLGLSATAAESPLKMKALGYLLGLHKYQDQFSWCLANGCYKNPWGALEFVPSKVLGGKHMLAIHKQIFPERGMRVRISELDDFPENAIFADAYDMGDHTDEINKIYGELEGKLQKPDPDDPAVVALLRARQQTELFKVPVLVEMTEDLIEEGKKIVIFVNFRETLNQLVFKLREHRPMSIYGGQGAADRDQAIRRFQESQLRVIVCMIQAGGVGISLHDTTGEYPRVSLITPSYSAREMKQALGRIHRAGGKSKCIQRIIFAAGTVEEEACRSVRRKLHNVALLNDGDLTEGLPF